MNMFVLDHEASVRLGFFLAAFSLVAVWEMIAPRRPLQAPKTVRWLNNLAITAVNTLAVRFLLPVAAVGAAQTARAEGIGLFRASPVPEWLAGAATVVLLDLVIYAQHALFHKVPTLWRLHRMHHTDLDVDVTTGSRFHPIEILLSMVIKTGAVLLLGSPAWSVIAFEVLLNATSMFNHGNVAIVPGLDRLVRIVLVTPDMHRVHHSVIIRETDSNFGFNLPWWDRLFGTYRDQPAAGHLEMKLGLANYRERKYLSLPWMLAVPFLHPER